jgi:hypothetical protein
MHKNDPPLMEEQALKERRSSCEIKGKGVN